ncbi:glycoside hydrolase family 16 protein [Aspergillus ibericus CBS 121593]|uniref:Concanavalin A-like lectin/glucanase n=1 Tax=Aspergillus ibericus CBS 121593 TaxID=1448316 RepID=A0A395GI88_9EURO|nr:concanavalin A-like lectin/glucanase [Aspergillus ibericus CBS 121593]RAK95054.1 concanavalin A-like lectin/glucanase [Aspergillus ibericus CBS 121593]
MKLILPYLLPSLSILATPATAGSIPQPQSQSPTTQPTNDPHSLCDCYLTTGQEQSYFTHYKFWDFRKVTLPQTIETTQADPANPQNSYDLQTYPLAKSPFSHDWRAQTWDRDATPISPVPMVNTDRNVFLLKDPASTSNNSRSSFLVLRTTRFADHASTAEVEGLFGYIYHCSLRMRLRMMSRDAIVQQAAVPSTGIAVNPPAQAQAVPRGSCAGIFTYRSAVCESDIEILTSEDPHTVHYANQPDYDPISDTSIPGASSIVNLSTPWTSWVTHRLDWLPNMSAWYADDKLQSNSTYSIPDRPSIVAMNLWSNGGNWSGDMRVGDSVYMGIEWIELLYNVTKADQDLPIKDHPGHRVHYRRPLDLASMGDGIPDSSAEAPRDYVDLQTAKKSGCQRPCRVDQWHHACGAFEPAS